MSILYHLLIGKFRRQLSKGKEDRALISLNRSGSYNIQRMYSENVNQWVKSKEYNLLSLFLKSDEVLYPNASDLLHQAICGKDKDLACMLAKAGIFKCKDFTFFIHLSIALEPLKTIYWEESESLISSMFSDENKTQEELNFVIESWNDLVEFGRKNKFNTTENFIEQINPRVQLFIETTQIKNKLSQSLPLAQQKEVLTKKRI